MKNIIISTLLSVMTMAFIIGGVITIGILNENADFYTIEEMNALIISNQVDSVYNERHVMVDGKMYYYHSIKHGYIHVEKNK